MAAAPQQGQQDNSNGMLWILIGLFVLGCLLWYFASPQIKYLFLQIKYYEILLIGLFTEKLVVVQQWIQSMPVSQIYPKDLGRVASIVGAYFKWPVAIILFACAAYVSTKDVSRKYRKTYDMKLFLKCEQKIWPHCSPVVKTNLIDVPITKGPWAMSVQPMEFAKKNNLLVEEIKALHEGQLSKEQAVTVTLNQGQANKFFSLQLGPLWQGLEKAPMHVKALFVIFHSRADNDVALSDKLLEQISRSALSGKLDFSGVDALVKKYAKTELTKKVGAQHAYMLTVMTAMLDLGRTSGVLASADFLWLKPVDRRLWYMLNNVGRWTSFTEVAGPRAHYLAEIELGRKIVAPMIEEAGVSLEEAIKEIAYKSDRDLEAERLGLN